MRRAGQRQGVDHASVQLYRSATSRCVGGANHAPGPNRSSPSARRKRPVHDGDLWRGPDAQPRPEAEMQTRMRCFQRASRSSLSEATVTVDRAGCQPARARSPSLRQSRRGTNSRSSSERCSPVSAMKSMCPTASLSTPWSSNNGTATQRNQPAARFDPAARWRCQAASLRRPRSACPPRRLLGADHGGPGATRARQPVEVGAARRGFERRSCGPPAVTRLS